MIFSKPRFIIFPTLRINMVMIVGRMPGSVTCIICFHRPAPSILAASYNSELIPAIAAIYMMEPQPIPCHISEIT